MADADRVNRRFSMLNPFAQPQQQSDPPAGSGTDFQPAATNPFAAALPPRPAAADSPPQVPSRDGRSASISVSASNGPPSLPSRDSRSQSVSQGPPQLPPRNETGSSTPPPQLPPRSASSTNPFASSSQSQTPPQLPSRDSRAASVSAAPAPVQTSQPPPSLPPRQEQPPALPSRQEAPPALPTRQPSAPTVTSTAPAQPARSSYVSIHSANAYQGMQSSYSRDNQTPNSSGSFGRPPPPALDPSKPAGYYYGNAPTTTQAVDPQYQPAGSAPQASTGSSAPAMYGQYPGGMAPPDQSQQPGGPPRTFMSIDLHAKSLKDSTFFNCETLAKECTRTSKTDFDRARAIFTWIATHVSFDVNLLTINPTDLERLCDPEALVQSRRTVPRGFALLYQRLCNLAGLTAVTIDGVCRYPAVFDTYTASIRDCWNAVMVNGKFWLVDCFMACGTMDKKRPGVFLQQFEGFWCFVEPSQFIFSHYPCDPKWELLGANPPVEGALVQRSQDYNAWWGHPIYFPSFFQERGKLESPQVPSFVNADTYDFRVYLPSSRKLSIITMSGGPLQASQDLRKDGRHFVGQWVCKAYTGTRIILGTDKVTPQGMQYDVMVEWMVADGMNQILKNLPQQVGTVSPNVISVGRHGQPAASGGYYASTTPQTSADSPSMYNIGRNSQANSSGGYSPQQGGYTSHSQAASAPGGYNPSPQPTYSQPQPTYQPGPSPNQDRLALERQRQAKEKQMESQGTGALLFGASVLSPTFGLGLASYNIGTGMHKTSKELNSIEKQQAAQKQQQQQQQWQ